MPKKKQKKDKKGNFAKIPFQKMPLESMIGNKAKKAPIKSQGLFTRRSQ